MQPSMPRRSFLAATLQAAAGAALLGAPPAWPVARAAPRAVPSPAWMQANLATLGARTLRRLCMPGAHDAGMSTLASGTLFATACNTQTQTLGILGLLQCGVRYFDIRPVISNGGYLTGHYSLIDELGVKTWQGANGQSIASIVEDVNAFTADNGELVVLYLSHDLDTDLGNSAYAPLAQAQWDDLLSTLQTGLNHLFVYQGSPGADLTTLPLQAFIGGGTAAVVVVVDGSMGTVDLGARAGQGFYLPANFPVYNVYADTDQLATMASDQLAKMAAQKPNPDNAYFLLSWTLTQSAAEVVACPAHLASSILDLAGQANAQLAAQLLPACSAETFPNIVYLDGITEALGLAALSMRINARG